MGEAAFASGNPAVGVCVCNACGKPPAAGTYLKNCMGCDGCVMYCTKECQVAHWQGLTLVLFSAQRKRFLWDRGCMWRLFGCCLGGVRGYKGVIRLYFASEAAQVEQRSGRV